MDSNLLSGHLNPFGDPFLMRRQFLTHFTLSRIGSGADHITSKCTGLKTAPEAPQWIL